MKKIYLIAALLLIFSIFASASASDSQTMSGSTYIAGVAAGSNEGVIGRLKITLINNGLGKVHFADNINLDNQAKESVINGIRQAEGYVNREGYDYFVEFDFPADSLSGKSSGAAATILTVSLLSGKKIDNTVITGYFDDKLSLVSVGGVIFKMQGAAKNGIMRFIASDTSTTVYVKQTKENAQNSGISPYKEYFIAQDIDLKMYGKKLGIEYMPIKNLDDAYNLLQ